MSTTIEQALDAYRADIEALDPERGAAWYADDAIVMDAMHAWRHVGREAIDAWIDEWLGMCETPSSLRFEDVRIEESGDLAVVIADARYEATVDGETAGMWCRFTQAWRRDAAGWRIVAEHTSVPLDEDGDVIERDDADADPDDD